MIKSYISFFSPETQSEVKVHDAAPSSVDTYPLILFSDYVHFFSASFFLLIFLIVVNIFEKRTWNTIARVVHNAVDTRRLMHASVVDTVVDVDLAQPPSKPPGHKQENSVGSR